MLLYYNFIKLKLWEDKNMRDDLFKKSWAVGLMVLFIVGGLTSNIGADDIRPTNTGKTWYVDANSNCPGDGTPDWPYCRIRYAIENASDTDDIKIASGLYPENLVIDKGDIIGNDAEIPIINGNNTGCVIEIRASWVEIKSMNITNSGNTDRDAGIYIEDYVELIKIRECEISHCHFGIWVHRTGVAGNPTNHIIRGNTIHDIQRQGILINFSDGNIISDNEITNCGCAGIHLWCSNDNIITENILKYNKYGIIIQCKVVNTIIGLLLMPESDNEVSSNTIIDSDRYCILLAYTKGNLIKDNNFMGDATFINGIRNGWAGNYWGGSPGPFFIFGYIHIWDFWIPYKIRVY